MNTTLHHGDCLKILPTLASGSMDAVATDPPYGLNFMNRRWDSPGVAFCPKTWQAVREVLKPGGIMLAFGGTRTFHRLACAIEDAGFIIEDCLMWIHGQGFPKHKSKLKPAWEPILLCRKPGPKWLGVEECRIGTEAAGWGGSRGGSDDPTQPRGRNYRLGAGEARPVEGRWPANVVLSDDPEVLEGFPQQQSGGTPAHRSSDKFRNTFGAFKGEEAVEGIGRTAGSAARFFYCAKASKSDRGEGNTHPTVKPLSLMSWLVRLACPVGGTVLDPFTGSGSTAVACLREGRDFIGVEREEAYVEIARRRIAEEQARFPLFAEDAV